MKGIRGLTIPTFLITCLLCGCVQTTQQVNDEVLQSSSGTTEPETADAVDLISNIPTTQYFTDTAVDEDDIETILMAGINAPSAMNGQPWHFSVITDASVLQQISDDMSMGFGGGKPSGNAAMPGGFPPENAELPEGIELQENTEPAITESEEGSENNLTGDSQPPEVPDDMELPENADKAKGPAGFAGGTASGSGTVTKAGLTDAPLAIVISCAEGSELDAGLACQNMSVTAQLLGYGTKIISSPTIALNGEKQEDYRELLGIPDDQDATAVLLIGYEDTTIDETVDGYTGATTRNPMDEVVTYVSAQ